MKKFVKIEKGGDKKIHACNKVNFSSNRNEVIRAVLNSFFFYKKILHALKAPKAPKALKARKTLKDTKTHKEV